MNNWKDEEVKALFKQVEQCKEESGSLVSAFAQHAKNFNRKPNSVRNYYYHEVDALSVDKKRCQRLGISLQKHDKTHFEGFDKIQENDLFEKIEKLVAKGFSVRSACLNLSEGNLPLMTRYQNKYQNMKRKIEKKNNIIPFKKQKALTENEINSLFMGLVKLIKKNAADEAYEKSKINELELKKTALALNEKEQEIDFLKNEMQKLKAENSMLIKSLKSPTAKKIALEKHLSGKKLTSQSQQA